MSLSVREQEDGVVLVTIDDGDKNLFDTALFGALEQTLDDVADVDAVVIAGREGVLSAGLDLKVFQSGDPDAMFELIVRFGETMLRIWTEPRPVVVAATGHAVAAGTILAMAGDHAVAAEGDYRWGLTETSVGLLLPAWIIGLARANVRTDRLEDLLLPGLVVGPGEAVEAGFADRLSPPGEVVDRALERASGLAALPSRAYVANKQALRGDQADRLRAGLESEARDLLEAAGTS